MKTTGARLPILLIVAFAAKSLLFATDKPSIDTILDYQPLPNLPVPIQGAAIGTVGHTLLVADARIETPGWRPLADYPLVWTVVVHEPIDLNLRHSIPLQEMFAHDVRVATSYAPVFERRTPRRDLEWRRRLILNAAGRWSSAHF